MFKKIFLSTLAVLIAAASGIGAGAALAAPAAADSASSDTAGLLYMYEEEKLARDVYNALYTVWGEQVFQMIVRSEQAHMDAVATLLTAEGTAIPQTAPGVFNDAALQALYNELLAAGKVSLVDALKVGAKIEELDILDLQERLAVTSDTAVQQVYNNLLAGSANHLRAFVRVLERQTGETYQPVLLSADAYNTILAASTGMSGERMGDRGQGGMRGSSGMTPPQDGSMMTQPQGGSRMQEPGTGDRTGTEAETTLVDRIRNWFGGRGR